MGNDVYNYKENVMPKVLVAFQYLGKNEHEVIVPCLPDCRFTISEVAEIMRSGKEKVQQAVRDHIRDRGPIKQREMGELINDPMYGRYLWFALDITLEDEEEAITA